MKKFIYTLLVPILSALALGSCESIVYDDEYSKDGFYHGKNNVYFYYENPDDTLRQYSFGAQPESMTSQTVKVPVRLAGVPSKKAQSFQVVVDTASTAKAGVHYTALPTAYTIPADSVNGEVAVTFLRSGMPTDRDTVTLILHLQATNDLGVRYPTNNTVKITFNNVLEEPMMWRYFEYYFGRYERRKYLEMLAYYDSSETKMWNSVNTDGVRFFLNFVKVWEKLMADPDYKYKDWLPTKKKLYNPYE